MSRCPCCAKRIPMGRPFGCITWMTRFPQERPHDVREEAGSISAARGEGRPEFHARSRRVPRAVLSEIPRSDVRRRGGGAGEGLRGDVAELHGVPEVAAHTEGGAG